MTITLLEPVVDTILDYLVTNMPAKVTSLNSRYADTLPNIAGVYRGELPQRMPVSPSICVRGSGFRPKAQRAANLELQYAIDVIVFVCNDDPERRYEMICRYVVGVLELVNAVQTVSLRIRLSGSSRFTDTSESPDFLQGFIISLVADVTESY